MVRQYPFLLTRDQFIKDTVKVNLWDANIQVPVDIQSNYYYGTTLLPFGTYSASTVSSLLDVGNFKEANLYLYVSSVGASSTLDCTILTLDPVSGASFPLATFPTITSPSKELLTLSSNLGYKLVASFDISGTIACSLGAVLKT